MRTTLQSLSGVSPIVFHFTGFLQASKIFSQNKFELKSSEGTAAEQSIKQGTNYLSTTRHRAGAYHLRNDNGVLIELDGTKLNQKYKGKSQDYWGGYPNDSYRAQHHEAEDRVFVKDHTIPNALQYVRAVDLLLYNGTVRTDIEGRAVRKIYLICKQQGIPVRVYKDRKAFISGNKTQAMSYEDLIGDVMRMRSGSPDRKSMTGERFNNRKGSMTELFHILELAKGYRWNDLTPESRDFYNRRLSHRSDPQQYLAAFNSEMHGAKSSRAEYGNNKTNEKQQGQKLVDFMRKHKMDELKLLQYIHSKWQAR